METIILIAVVVFWTLFYILEGMHDVRVVEEIKLLKKYISLENLKTIESDIVQKEISWKLWGGFEKGLTKIVISVVIYLFTNDIYFSFLCLMLSVSLRWFIHDLTVAMGLGLGLSHIGPDFIWTDKILIKLQNQGINQYVVKITLNLVIILLTLAHIYF